MEQRVNELRGEAGLLQDGDGGQREAEQAGVVQHCVQPAGTAFGQTDSLAYILNGSIVFPADKEGKVLLHHHQHGFCRGLRRALNGIVETRAAGFIDNLSSPSSTGKEINTDQDL